MPKNKLYRYAKVKNLPNIIERRHFKRGDYADVRGKWGRDIFMNDQPITLELACGKGDYLLALARKTPHCNYVGVDIKGDRIWKGATQAIEEKLTNVRFLRIFIDHIENFFAPGEVSEIWITFPDPYISSTKESKRLTSPPFLDRYRNILKPGGSIHLKTDSVSLFEYTLETLHYQDITICKSIEDVYCMDKVPELLDIQTYYEKIHLKDGKTIKYLKFRFDRS